MIIPDRANGKLLLSMEEYIHFEGIVDKIKTNLLKGWQGSRAAGWHNDGILLDIPMSEDDLVITCDFLTDIDVKRHDDGVAFTYGKYYCAIDFEAGDIIFICQYDFNTRTATAKGFVSNSDEAVTEYIRIFKEEENENE